jgi:hypothetical protein
MKRVTLSAVMALLLCWPAMAQTYGSGKTITVPYVEPGTITIDGNGSEAAWGNAALISMGAGDFHWDGGWLDGYAPEPDIEVDARLLYTDGKLLIHLTYQHYAAFYWKGFGGNALIVGFEPAHVPGTSDRLSTGWNGFAGNNPNDAPFTLYMNGERGCTVNWSEDIDPVANGWVECVVSIDEENFTMTVEAAIHSTGIERGRSVGFNVGGVAALEEKIWNDDDEGDYAWFSWGICDQGTAPEGIWCGPGGNILQNTLGYGSLMLQGEQYGSGKTLVVPYVPLGTITIDGQGTEAAWESAAVLSIAADDFHWDGGWLDGYAPDPDIEYDVRVLYTDGKLLMHIAYQHYDDFFWNQFGGNAVIVGFDPLHIPGVSDRMSTGWNGFAGNNPNEAPFVIYANGERGCTVNWSEDIDPIANGWIECAVSVDAENFLMTIELAINSEKVMPGAHVGMNVGGVAALEEKIWNDDGDGDYAWFSWGICDQGTAPQGIWCGPGGNILQNTLGYGSLSLQEVQYGSGKTLEVARVAPGTIVIDGYANEAAWESAGMISMAAGDFHWDGGWLDGYAPEPDIEVDAHVLYTDGALYLHITYQHYDEFYWHRFGGNALIVGFDPLHMPGISDMMSTGWNGFAGNNPEEAPFTMYINGEEGCTVNWSEDIDPVANGWVDCVVVVDEANFTMMVEMAIKSSKVQPGARVGLNVGGVAALEEKIWNDDDEGDYAWFSWGICDQGTAPQGIWCGPGGNILQNTMGYGSLNLRLGTSIDETYREEIPVVYTLSQNYPNPFNPTTTIEYAVPHIADVRLEVYNLLGQLVATLVEGQAIAGTHRVTWDAGSLSSGVYLSRLTVNGQHVATKKMLLVK